MNQTDSYMGLTSQQLREFYETEKSLAKRLRLATRLERRRLYQTVYNELYARVPFHPMLTRKITPEESATNVERSMRYLSCFLKPGMTVLEIGAGDCALSFALAKKAHKVYAIEVSDLISSNPNQPPNFELVISDGTSIPVPEGSIDVAVSNQLMEHLHPDDAREQLANIFVSLKPGGMYVCNTPNRLAGPTDVSQFFDDVATGLHLKEYTFAELDDLFRKAGFRKVVVYVEKSGQYRRAPMAAMRLFEKLSWMVFGGKPFPVRQRWLRRRPFTLYLQGMQVVGVKE